MRGRLWRAQPGPENIRNGYRQREWDTRAGSISLAIPKLRHGSYFPDWLLERRRRAEAALVTVVATSYLLGVSTRRMEKLVETLGITRLSKSQVSEMAKDLDSQVEAFRTRPLDAGHYTFVAAENHAVPSSHTTPPDVTGSFGVTRADRTSRFVSVSIGFHLILGWPECWL